ncbi:Proteasome subunit beta type-2 [Hondaea fermentalgiana]|uniref:Proteasome subunit beta n=1 Tax=Hondaea fermentalgiana TaxID=2315210 RepID=A0A2R5GDP9_9STRA|nr:Proteasome subunit beta type-2 [Hondaea fermentalgiana]|eukprot:GBG28449.1 Proteasome subunit beta type-2 [Hondaea fermentalgiana]
MDVVLGVTGKGYAMVLTDMTSNRSIFSLKHDEDKAAMVDERKVLACGGDQASRSQFTEYVSKNFALTALRTGLEMSNHAAAHFVRNELARAIRARGGPHQANSILAGVDHEGPAMYYLDYLGTMAKVDYAAQGYCGYFSLSLMDKNWKRNMTKEEGRDLLLMCIDQLRARFIINSTRYKLIVVDETGKSAEEIIEP